MNTTRINSNAVIMHGNVIGCPEWKIADVWVKCRNLQDAMERYSSMTTIENGWYGNLVTRRCPQDSLPKKVGPERSQAVDKHYGKLKKAARRLLNRFQIPYSETL